MPQGKNAASYKEKRRQADGKKQDAGRVRANDPSAADREVGGTAF
jgi:hypothetical protein